MTSFFLGQQTRTFPFNISLSQIAKTKPRGIGDICNKREDEKEKLVIRRILLYANTAFSYYFGGFDTFY